MAKLFPIADWYGIVLYLNRKKVMEQIPPRIKLPVDHRTSSACRRKVLFSALAHSMHSRHSSTSWPVAASMSRNRSSRERTSRAALALLIEIRKGLTNFSSPPSSGDGHKK